MESRIKNMKLTNNDYNKFEHEVTKDNLTNRADLPYVHVCDVIVGYSKSPGFKDAESMFIYDKEDHFEYFFRKFPEENTSVELDDSVIIHHSEYMYTDGVRLHEIASNAALAIDSAPWLFTIKTARLFYSYSTDSFYICGKESPISNEKLPLFKIQLERTRFIGEFVEYFRTRIMGVSITEDETAELYDVYSMTDLIEYMKRYEIDRMEYKNDNQFCPPKELVYKNTQVLYDENTEKNYMKLIDWDGEEYILYDHNLIIKFIDTKLITFHQPSKLVAFGGHSVLAECMTISFKFKE